MSYWENHDFFLSRLEYVEEFMGVIKYVPTSNGNSIKYNLIMK